MANARVANPGPSACLRFHAVQNSRSSMLKSLSPDQPGMAVTTLTIRVLTMCGRNGWDGLTRPSASERQGSHCEIREGSTAQELSARPAWDPRPSRGSFPAPCTPTL